MNPHSSSSYTQKVHQSDHRCKHSLTSLYRNFIQLVLISEFQASDYCFKFFPAVTMSSTNKKIAVVFGATGVHGGSVVRALLSNPTASRHFHIRAITRGPSAPAAAALIKQGSQIVKVSSLTVEYTHYFPIRCYSS